MNDHIITYIKELELRLVEAGRRLPAMREDIQHLLKPEDKKKKSSVGNLSVNINADTLGLKEMIDDALKKIASDMGEETGKEKNNPLLVIELENESSVPKIIFKGKEVEGKREILFHWETDTSIPGGLTYAIEHAEKENCFATNRIERRVKGHACD